MTIDTAKARSIFIAAVEGHSPEQWDAFLDDACGKDLALRQRVELLLRAHQGEDSFLDRGENDEAGATIDRPIAEHPGTAIGPYKLLEQIGEGGFGVVFLAEQERPVRRRAALKIIKPGMDTRQVVVRFEAERQALALMDHPDIAKVFDAGTTETGRPYFVMELVQGVPITDYCDQCNLTTRERLELFITVCQALQHAHQKGVIHRDIKPTNVLVAMQDGKPAPKLIDFGVAKALNQRLTEHTLATGYAQMIGTPLYMSPEQAELSPLGADTRSDIYSLGVLLYEMLTGTTPFDKERLRSASFDELRRILCQEEPPRPSARLSALRSGELSRTADSLPHTGSTGEEGSAKVTAAFATTIAEHRRTDPGRLVQTVRGELDWIVMKCLEKDRTRRYETADALGRDIQRYLADEPVHACPPSTAYLLRKFIRRNKLAAAFVLVLLSALGFLAISNVIITRERDAKAAALSVARANERIAVTEIARAKEVAELLLQMLASSNPERAKGQDYTVRQLLDDFSAGLGERLADQPDVRATVHATIGNAYRRLGLTDQAQTHLQTALDLRRRLLEADHQLIAESLVDYAWNLAEQTRHEEALNLLDEALDIYRVRSNSPEATLKALWAKQRFLTSLHNYRDAEATVEEALDMAGPIDSVSVPAVANILHTYADSLLNQRRYGEAEEAATKAVAIHRRLRSAGHPETAWGLLVLGKALKAQNKYSDAEAALRESVEIFAALYDDEYKGLRTARVELASVQVARGNELKQLALEQLRGSRFAEAIITLQEALPTIGADGTTFLVLAIAHWREGQYEEARGWYRAALRRLPRYTDPNHYTRDLANQAEALIRAESGQSIAALDTSKAIEEYSRAIGRDPDAAWAYQLRGQAYSEQKRFAEAKADYVRALEILFRERGLPVDVPTVNAFGFNCMESRQWGLMAAAYDKAIELEPSYYRSYQERGFAHLWLGDFEAMLADQSRAIELNPEHGQQWMRRGIAHARLGKLERALEDMNKGFDLAPAHAWEWPWIERANVLLELGQWKDAVADLEGMLATMPDNLSQRYRLALAARGADDISRYRTACAKLIAHLQRDNWNASDWTYSWPVLLSPVAGTAEELGRLADKMASQDTHGHSEKITIGAAQLRAGQTESAIEQLHEAHRIWQEASEKPTAHSPAYTAFLLAIAYSQSDRIDDAQNWFDEGNGLASAELDAAVQSGKAPPWQRRLGLQLLREEAEQSIKTHANAAEKAAGDSIKSSRDVTLRRQSAGAGTGK